ncbi:MAG: hypothetical protein OJF50_006754 [Nitrospira sp.]|jgi:hypothetical protein|nr:hypothetical protein [Nitrospira sp.]
MPAMMMALGGGALSVGGGIAKAFGGDSQAKAARKAAQMYIDYQERERKKFLDANSPIRDKLMTYSQGKSGYDDDLLRGMKDDVNEDYGQGLADVSRISANSAVGKNSGGGNVYTPGRYDRATRQLGQNLAMNKAKMIRDVNQKNADMAVSNQRFAVSALPTYSPGLSATPQIGYDAFQGLNATAPIGNYIGDMLQGLGQPAMSAGMDGLVRGPIAEKLAKIQAQNNQQQPGPWQSYYVSPHLRY